MATDFYLLVCSYIRMLFRPSIRWHLGFLVLAFLTIMGYNVFSHFEAFKAIRLSQQEIRNEAGFKLFFLYTLEKSQINAFNEELEDTVKGYGGEFVNDAFIYRQNLYINVDEYSEERGLKALYRMFGMEDYVRGYAVPGKKRNTVDVKAEYMDYSAGAEGLSQKAAKSIFRRSEVKRRALSMDLYDFSSNIPYSRSSLAFEAKVDEIVECLDRHAGNSEMKWYLSRVNLIVPMQILTLLTHAKHATDEILEDAIVVDCDGATHAITARARYLNLESQLKDIERIALNSFVPRYSAMFVDKFVDVKHENLYVLLSYKSKVVEDIERWKAEGHGLLSYEKLHYILHTVERLNREMKRIQGYHVSIDVLIGVVFPFMVSLFISISSGIWGRTKYNAMILVC